MRVPQADALAARTAAELEPRVLQLLDLRVTRQLDGPLLALQLAQPLADVDEVLLEDVRPQPTLAQLALVRLLLEAQQPHEVVLEDVQQPDLVLQGLQLALQPGDALAQLGHALVGHVLLEPLAQLHRHDLAALAADPQALGVQREGQPADHELASAGGHGRRATDGRAPPVDGHALDPGLERGVRGVDSGPRILRRCGEGHEEEFEQHNGTSAPGSRLAGPA